MSFSNNYHAELQQISSVQFANKILLDLKKIQPYYGEPVAAIYADNLLRTMQEMRDQFPEEPLTEFVMALYDAIATSNYWIDYNAHQYQGAYDILTTLVNSQLSNDNIEQGILSLENLGFDTLPFSVDVDFSDINTREIVA
jgi:hypothetical protein